MSFSLSSGGPACRPQGLALRSRPRLSRGRTVPATGSEPAQRTHYNAPPFLFIDMKYESIIGLEIHVQLKTKSKLFCSCSNAGEYEPPNTTVCPVCLAHPGTLPVTNKEALIFAIKASKALGCIITSQSKFDRKHYFYPDLPKAYQISQYDRPVGTNGLVRIEIDNPEAVRKTADVRINRLHLEEDAAKNIHENGATLVDFNRCGTPLSEIVTEPDLRTPEEAKIFLQELRTLMRTIGVSEADMEKGHMRCDANISIRPAGDNKLYPKTEVKNINSFRAVERALKYEIDRQTKLWEEGNPVNYLSTRGWDDDKQQTFEQRKKEEAHDYRYFPDPDLPPLNLAELERDVTLPELPPAKRLRFAQEYCFAPDAAKLLADDPDWADFAENVMSETYAWLKATPGYTAAAEHKQREECSTVGKLVSSWILNRLMRQMADAAIDIRILKITPENFAEFITLIHTSQINSSNAQKLLGFMLEAGEDPSHIMEEKGLGQVADAGFIENAVMRVVENNPKQVEQYRAGKVEVIKFLIGMVMKETEGKVDPKLATEKLKEKLG